MCRIVETAETCQCRRGERLFLFFWCFGEFFAWPTRNSKSQNKVYFSGVDGGVPIAQRLSVDSESKEKIEGLGKWGVNVESNRWSENQTVSWNRIKQVESETPMRYPPRRSKVENGERKILEPNTEKRIGRSRDETLQPL